MAGKAGRAHSLHSSQGLRLRPIHGGDWRGKLNFDRVFEKAEAGGTQTMLVEQDDCHGEDPFACLKRSYDYLVSRGFR